MASEQQKEQWRQNWKKRYERDRERILAHKRRSYRKNIQYYSAWSRARQDDARAFLNSLKARPCADCGENYPPFVMDFDHRSDSQKLMNVGDLVRVHAPRELVLEEVAKCDLVCANCHRVRTHGRRQFTRKAA